MSVVLEARGLTAGYGELPAIRDIDIEVSSGEIVALLGPNGAGKTTTVSSLAGMLPPMRGEVHLNGKRCRLPLHRRAQQGLAIVPEERSVFKGLSTRDNLRLGDASVDGALEVFPELKPLLDRRAGLLSGGEQQMLSVGRALSRKPSVLLVDELSLGLAPMVVKRLMVALRRAADNGAAILMVEQHMQVALGIADRAHVMNRGRIVLSGTSAEMSGRLDDIRMVYLSEGVLNPDAEPK